MRRTERCPKCGSHEIGEGHYHSQAGLGTLYSSRWMFDGSTVFAAVCSNCGLIIEQWVEQPKKFAPQSADS